MKFTDPKSIASRIRTARHNRGLSQAELGAKIGVKQSNVGRWEQGEHTPRSSTLRRIAEALEINLHWLVTGEGEMEPTEQERLTEQLARGELPSEDLQAEPVRWIPVLGCVPGGNPFAPEVVPLDMIVVSAEDIRHPRAFALRVTGDSMAPAIQDGDLVACEPYEGEALAPGTIVVALIQGEAMLKSYIRRGDQHLLVSADNSIPPITLGEGDRILARVVSVHKQL